MSDFLRNLRSSHKKDKSDPKRNLDGHYYPKDDRRLNFDRRSNNNQNLSDVLGALQESVSKFTEHVDDITEELRILRINNDKITQAKLKQIESSTSFFQQLNKIFKDDLFKNPPSQSSDSGAGYTLGKNYTKNDILQIIKTMRNKGSTFSLIAQYLQDKGIPTFSGRGEWHAQTIHRLCK